MEAQKGDRISIDPKRVGQPRRSGVVEKVSRGLSGPRYTVRWDDGHATTFNPGAGVLTVDRRAKAKSTKSNSSPKRKSKANTRSKKR